MDCKYLEILDRGTCMPALAIPLIPGIDKNLRVNALLRRAGFGADHRCIYLLLLEVNQGTWDPFKWGPERRTPFNAHHYIEEHYDELEDGGIVDVQLILGETDKIGETDL